MMPDQWPDGGDAATARALEGSHDTAAEEWLFTCWVPLGAADQPPVGIVSGYRRFARGPSWYWAAVARPGRPLLHVADWSVPPRSDPLLVKGDGLWAEHVCDAPLEQWTVANETYAAALDDPAEALGRGYGAPTALAFDLEWYATGSVVRLPDGYEQPGVVHATIELAGEPGLRLAEVPAHRWHRWGDVLVPVELPVAFAHTSVRAPFAFPDGTTVDWALTTDGWRSRGGPPRRTDQVPAGGI